MRASNGVRIACLVAYASSCVPPEKKEPEAPKYTHGTKPYPYANFPQQPQYPYPPQQPYPPPQPYPPQQPYPPPPQQPQYPYPPQQPYPPPPQQPYPPPQQQPYPQPQPQPAQPEQQPQPQPQPQPEQQPQPQPEQQPQPYPPPPPQPPRLPPVRQERGGDDPDMQSPRVYEPDVPEPEWTASEPVRLVNVMGTSGTLHPDRDLQLAIGFGTRKWWRFHRMMSGGIRNQVLLRNWSETSRYYGYIADCEKIDARCDRRANYWSVGWLMALASAEVGWEITLRAEGPDQPWLSVGTSAMLFQNAEGLGEEGTVDWVVAHTGTLAAGYDFGVVGVGAHFAYANDSILLASSGPRMFSLLFSLEILLPRDHGDRRRRH